MSDVLLITNEGGVRTLTLNRPERKNSISADLREEMLAQIDDARADEEVRCLVITGAGDAFCSGVDLTRSGVTKEATAGERRAPDLRAIRESMKSGMQRVITSLWELDKPVIASVNGVAAGGGAQLALVCDLVVAAESARFIEIFVKRGLAVDSGGGWLLPRLVGLHKAKEMVFFGESVSARDALGMGLINRVVPDAELPAATAEWASKLATGATRAIGVSKGLLNRALTQDLASALDDEATAQAYVSQTDDFREGVRAFAEKRAAEFKGR
ncbi:MAG TPA: enoyl-CoA hydratase [Actinomycetota bacterium]|nr:enoyl-CoA hydratase [Actinomycetota bacterium]